MHFWEILAVLCIGASGVSASALPRRPTPPPRHDTKVLILGGGVAGIIAARTLKQQGIDDFIIVEGRDELGGRMRSHEFSGYTIEVGANWIQGTRNTSASGPVNPMLELAEKHGLKFQGSNPYTSLLTYDNHGPVNYTDLVKEALGAHNRMIAAAGIRIAKNLVDVTAKTGLSIIGAKPLTTRQLAAEYLAFDWEFAQKPDQTSWVASSWASNHTFKTEGGGFSDDNDLSIDQRGFKMIIQKEAEEYFNSSHIRLGTVVRDIRYTDDGVIVTTADNSTISADYAICTFSLGVLQNDDVTFSPPLPAYKVEAIQTMTMATYTKIFMKFPKKFWFDTEFALYADPERGRYPIWQSLDHPDFFPGSGLIFATVTGDYSKRIEALPFEQVQSEVMDVLRSMYPNITVPEPTDFYFQRWNSDPLYRGSYSNWPPSFFIEHHNNLRANEGRLYFAGEATSERHFGYLHGAYYEGQAIGSIVANCTNGLDCVHLAHVEEVVNARPYRTGDSASRWNSLRLQDLFRRGLEVLRFYLMAGN
ncbi:hypothetical protein AX16_010225 [Volvariella volvacea WC 439]|nr:hypothetical protein AX16_010225 [Volvariella volvacea WC 439]